MDPTDKSYMTLFKNTLIEFNRIQYSSLNYNVTLRELKSQKET